ncbi:MAG: RagB/SusD family nutrient uptake outer membrane protein [Alistipes senegalensis]
MYAEAKIELNEIDDATLEAMNRVRARASGVQHTETDKYPAIVTRSQSELRTILRTERRWSSHSSGCASMTSCAGGSPRRC